MTQKATCNYPDCHCPFDKDADADCLLGPSEPMNTINECSLIMDSDDL